MAARAAIPVYRSPMWPWFLVSGIVHALVVILGIVSGALGAGSALLAGRGVEDGSGFSGSSVDFEIEGPEDRPATGSMAGQSAAPQPEMVEPQPLEPVELEPAEAPREPVEEAPPELPPTRDEGALAVAAAAPRPRPRPALPVVQPLPGRSPEPSEGAAEATEETSPGEGEPGGTGAEASTAGAQAGDPTALILGAAGLGGDSVAAQRALLPNGGLCDDPATGTWQAQKFRATDRSWVRFTLRVRRAGGALAGTITSRIWTGRASDPRPGPCTAFGSDHTWRMTATGTVEGETMTFVSRRARLVEEHCPSRGNVYAPDRFRGTLRPLREVFDAVNNDGAYDIDEPYTFRRVSCEP